jgi:HEAT repeat protein
MGPHHAPTSGSGQTPQRPLPPSIVRTAKWPPDDDALPPGLPPGPGGFAPSYDGGDGNFKRGRFAPIAIIVGILAVGGIAGALVFGSMKDAEKMDPKKVAILKRDTALLPLPEALPTYRKWAEDGQEIKLQEEAFTQLAWAKDPQGLQLIIKGLKSIDHNVRGTAAQALLEYGSPAADSARPALLAALKEATEADRPQIAWALAALHEPTAFDDVMKEYRAGKLASVQKLDKSPAFDPEQLASMVSIDKLAGFAGDESESVRQLVATVLSKSADPKYTAVLIKLVKDKSTDVAREAAVGLGKIANEEAMGPLLEALSRADKDSRQKFLEAMRDGVGGKGLVLALQTVDKQNPSTANFQTKVIFDMLKSLEDPRAGDALVKYLETANPPPHWKTEAAIRLAEIGDLRAVPYLGWRMEQDPTKIYKDDNSLNRDDNERVIASRMLADLAVLYPDKRPDIRAQSEKQVMHWLTDKPQPHANGLRYIAASDARDALPQMRKWANPAKPFPKPGQQDFPAEWATAQSTLRYLGWMQDAQSWPLLEEQLRRRPKDVDATMDSLLQGGLGVLGMVLRAVGVGASQGFAQWGDAKAYQPLVKYIEDKMNNEQSRQDACFSLAWVATDDEMGEVANKIKELDKPDPKTQVVRACYLETLVHRPVSSATAALADLINGSTDVGVQHQAARAIGFGGMSPETTAKMFEKLKNASTRNDAMLAILIGGDADAARRALATYDDDQARAQLEELKVVYDQTFGYWSDKNYESGDVARWIANAQAASRVKLGDAIQDWPRMILARAIQGIDYDNGPHSVTRVQMRIRLLRDARGSDERKRLQAIQILKFMGEKGCLMALKGESGPQQEPARQAFFELMNPKMTTDAMPEQKAAGNAPPKP